MDIGERIKKLRQKIRITQQSFADSLGLKQNTIATYEMGRLQPSDRTIADICREFNVNEEWLRTGEGEMFVEMSRDEEIAAFVGDILSEESDDFKHRLIIALSRLDATGWKVLEQFANDLVNTDENKKS